MKHVATVYSTLRVQSINQIEKCSATNTALHVHCHVWTTLWNTVRKLVKLKLISEIITSYRCIKMNEFHKHYFQNSPNRYRSYHNHLVFFHFFPILFKFYFHPRGWLIPMVVNFAADVSLTQSCTSNTEVRFKSLYWRISSLPISPVWRPYRPMPEASLYRPSGPTGRHPSALISFRRQPLREFVCDSDSTGVVVVGRRTLCGFHTYVGTVDMWVSCRGGVGCAASRLCTRD